MKTINDTARPGVFSTRTGLHEPPQLCGLEPTVQVQLTTARTIRHTLAPTPDRPVNRRFGHGLQTHYTPCYGSRPVDRADEQAEIQRRADEDAEYVRRGLEWQYAQRWA